MTLASTCCGLFLAGAFWFFTPPVGGHFLGEDYLAPPQPSPGEAPASLLSQPAPGLQVRTPT